MDRLSPLAASFLEAEDVDLRWHVRSTAIPVPGGDEEISRLLSRVMSHRMDRSRPRWQYRCCEGLSDRRWGLLSTIHHSMVDGVSGTDLYQLVLDQLVLDPSPDPRPAVPDLWQPEDPRSPIE